MVVNIFLILVGHLRTVKCEEKTTKKLTLGSERNINNINVIINIFKSINILLLG